LLSLTETHRYEDVSEFFSSEGWHQFDAGHTRLGLAWRTETKAWAPQIIAGSLYLAFVSMLWLDISDRRITLLRCANPRCGEYFTTDRPNTKYCIDKKCALNVAHRKWWNAKGAGRRKKTKEAEKISDSQPSYRHSDPGRSRRRDSRQQQPTRRSQKER
jgi:hypothetical protein